jgi:hypothetical protein
MNYEDELERYERDGEDRYDNYGGQGLPDEDDFYYEDDEYELVDGLGDEEYDSYSNDAVGRLDPNDTTYTFVVTNTTDEEHEVVLFGANENLSPPAGVTVEVAESSHNEVREESKANPFTIVGMKMSVSNSQQFDNVLFLYEKTSTGRTTTNVRQPRTWQSPQNFDQKSIHAINFTMHVTGKTSLRFKAKKGTTVFTFSVQSRTNLGNVLIGKNVAEVNTAPSVTGLPQMDDRLKPITKLRKLVQPIRKVQKLRVARPVRRPVRQTIRRAN